MQTKNIYAQIQGKRKEKLTLNAIIAVDVYSKIILYSQATKDPKHDYKIMQQLQIRSLKKYYVDYIIADKAYDTNKIRKCIKRRNINVSDKIPLKSNFKNMVEKIKHKKPLMKKYAPKQYIKYF